MDYFRVGPIGLTTALMSELKPLKSYPCNAQVTTSMEKLTCETLSYVYLADLIPNLLANRHVGQKLCN